MRSAIAFAACLLVLGAVNFSIMRKEQHLAGGRAVYLELAPVDPRSLMQGDYMALRFRMANDARSAIAGSARGADFPKTRDGRIVATLDAASVASFKRLDDGTALAPGEIYLRYRVREGEMKFATNAFFFREGTARRYEPARYGEARVTEDGDILLTGLRGRKLEPL